MQSLSEKMVPMKMINALLTFLIQPTTESNSLVCLMSKQVYAVKHNVTHGMILSLLITVMLGVSLY